MLVWLAWRLYPAGPNRQLPCQPDCSQWELQGYDLRGADLNRTDLSFANLRAANLQAAGLQLAVLSGAVLRNAEPAWGGPIDDTRLHLADLRDADLSEAICAARTSVRRTCGTQT